MNLIQNFGEVSVLSNAALLVMMEKTELEEGVFEYVFDIAWSGSLSAQAAMHLEWKLPCVDVQYMWHPSSGTKRILEGNWRMRHRSMMTISAPVGVLFNGADESIYTFASDEVRRVTSLHMGTQDSDNIALIQLKVNLGQYAGRTSHRIAVRADLRRIPVHEALDGVRAWWDSMLPPAMQVPESARLPMYSSWYCYHQKINAGELEEECRRAKAMGMHAIIVDDGWQCGDNSGGYGYTGDWEVWSGKIPDMKAHVAKVHEAGLKYILWYSVPFVGYHSKVFKRFEDMLLYRNEHLSCAVLDPRFPEVREYLIGIYETAMREWDLDGFKLDFIDSFYAPEGDQVRPGMDFTCVQEATERLMLDIAARLQTIKPDVMIEFRQDYIGPMMRRFGNMFRVGDCAMDIASNRIGIADIRMLAGDSAVHSDMLAWGPDESAEDAALQLLNSIFGVIQFSMILGELSEEHRRMSKFWLDFAQNHIDTLQKGAFIPREPHFLYPVIEAHGVDEAVVGVYARSKIVELPVKERVYLINATKDAQLYVNLSAPAKGKAMVWNTLGEVVREEEIELGAGIHRIDVPKSGMIGFNI